jgi:hypothetical protein
VCVKREDHSGFLGGYAFPEKGPIDIQGVHRDVAHVEEE